MPDNNRGVTIMKPGNVVMFRNPQPDETGLIFTVLEIRDDRVLVTIDVDMTINPSMVYLISDLEVVQ